MRTIGDHASESAAAEDQDEDDDDQERVGVHLNLKDAGSPMRRPRVSTACWKMCGAPCHRVREGHEEMEWAGHAGQAGGIKDVERTVNRRPEDHVAGGLL